MTSTSATFSATPVVLCNVRGDSDDSLRKNFLNSEEYEGNNHVEDEKPVEDEQDITDFSASESILCVLWQSGVLGAAYFKPSTSQLYVFRDIADLQPVFIGLKGLYREVNPKHTITLGYLNPGFKNALIETTINADDEEIDINRPKYMPSNLSLLPGKEYSKTACEHEIQKLTLASQPQKFTEEEKLLYLQSLIDFDNEMSTLALGVLLKYMDKNMARFAFDTRIQYLHISQVSIADMVFMDNNTFNALKIFQCVSHTSSFKHGGNNNNREGLSIFKMISSHCSSLVGTECLRNFLMHPTKNLEELQERHEFINLVLKPENSIFLNNLRMNIKRISNVQSCIRSIISSTKSGTSNWERLHRTIYHMLLIHQLCRPYYEHSRLLCKYNESITDDLYSLFDIIKSTLEFENCGNNNKLKIKSGLDPDYDAKKLKQEDLQRQLAVVASIVEKEIPRYIKNVCVSYLPDIGHLVVVSEPEENYGDPSTLFLHLRYRFLFLAYNKLHYKTPLCLELDRLYGDIHGEIMSHVNRIMLRLINYVKENIKNIQEPLRIIGNIDSLISMAMVALEYDHVQPILDNESMIEIENATHPLMEITVDNYVRNNFHSGGHYSHLKILTGPNASGKSVYLKQIAMIVYLAHVGCHVPAKFCRIGLVYSMHTRVQTMEAASVRLSAFMIDLQQMSHALHAARASSLIIIDEFGRGTVGTDSSVLLTALLKKFIDQKEFCCHILTSTHLQEITRLLPESEFISHIKMGYETIDNNMIFTYKVTDGVSSSFALNAALCGELDGNVIQRAQQGLKAFQSNMLPDPVPDVKGCYKPNVDLMKLCIPKPNKNYNDESETTVASTTTTSTSL